MPMWPAQVLVTPDSVCWHNTCGNIIHIIMMTPKQFARMCWHAIVARAITTIVLSINIAFTLQHFKALATAFC